MMFPLFRLFSIVFLLWGVVNDGNFAHLRFLRVFWIGRCGSIGISRGLVHVDFLVFLFSVSPVSQSSDGSEKGIVRAIGISREPSLS